MRVATGKGLPHRGAVRRGPLGPGPRAPILDRWRPWLAVAVVLVVLAYGPSLARMIATTPLDAPGFRVW